jgi:hypothetical protein
MIENGDDCNDIPESMRRYLALQAMESGKPLGRDFLGRAGGPMAAYGSGMLMNADNGSSKVGEFCQLLNGVNYDEQRLTCLSHSPLCMPLFEHWLMASCRAERDGSRNLLLP